VGGGELRTRQELLCGEWREQLLPVNSFHGLGRHEHLRLRVRELRLGNGKVCSMHTRTGGQVADSDDDAMRARAAGGGKDEEPSERCKHAHDTGEQARIQPARTLSVGGLGRQSDR